MGADLEQVRWWSWRRQRLDRSSRGIEDCLHSIIGVHGGSPQGALSLLARVPRVMGGMVDGAIESRLAVRLPAMRRAVWMLHADTAHLAFRSIDQAGPALASLRRIGMAENEYARLEREILLAAGRPMTAEQIREAIKKPPEKLGPVLHALTAEGKLLYIKQKTGPSNAFTYAATRVWLGHDLPEADPAEALVWLAGDYLKGFGPATVDDFAWWAGVPAARAGEAIGAHDPADVGDGLVMWPTDVHAFEGTRPVANRVNLLPAWDAYTMGYAEASRERFADPAVIPYLYDKNGNSTNVILVDGVVAGLWDFTLSDRRIVIRIGLFEDPTPRALASIEGEASLVAGYFNARDVEIRRVKIRSAISERAYASHLKPLAGEERPERAKPERAPAPRAAGPRAAGPRPVPLPVSRPGRTARPAAPARPAIPRQRAAGRSSQKRAPEAPPRSPRRAK